LTTRSRNGIIYLSNEREVIQMSILVQSKKAQKTMAKYLEENQYIFTIEFTKMGVVFKIEY
jgi:hypothetical protein